jgi:hypothetical protein
MRTRRRSHHIAAETVEEHLDDLPKACKPQTKRQRRLTVQQRGTNASLGGLKQLPAPKAAAAPALKKPVDPPVEPKVEAKPAPPVAPQILNNSSSLSEDDDEDDEPSCPGYISSGTSARMVPGKRIKWRSAISEGDIIRQDLSLAFLFATLNSSDDGEPPKSEEPVVVEPASVPLKTPASALRSKRR